MENLIQNGANCYNKMVHFLLSQGGTVLLEIGSLSEAYPGTRINSINANKRLTLSNTIFRLHNSLISVVRFHNQQRQMFFANRHVYNIRTNFIEGSET